MLYYIASAQPTQSRDDYSAAGTPKLDDALNITSDGKLFFGWLPGLITPMDRYRGAADGW